MRISRSSSLEQLLACPEPEWSLGDAALLVARDVEYPKLRVRSYQAELRELGAQLARTIPRGANVRYRLAALNEHMFTTLGFAGAGDEYYDPRNSFLNEVMDRRVGIPITLSIIYLELGRHAGLELAGVSFPGHFLVKIAVDEGIAIIDPYHGGLSLDEVDLQRRLAVGMAGETGVSQSLPEALQDASRREILSRMLRNLKLIYLQQAKWENALAVCTALVTTSEREPGELRDRGLVLDQLACPGAAASDLEAYLELAPNADDAAEIRNRLSTLKDQAGPLN